MTGSIQIRLDMADMAKLVSIRNLAWEGVNIDGGHHKQWYLVQIAQILDLNVDDVEPGVPG